MYRFHTFFIQSSVDGHLGGFHVLAIVNSAAMNNEIHVLFGFVFVFLNFGFLRVYAKSGNAGS